MLSMQTPIRDMEIEDIQELKRGVVFKLTGHGGERLIVKVDLIQEQNRFKHASAALKAVDKHGGNVKELMPSEKAALKAWCEFLQRTYKDFNENKTYSMQIMGMTKSIIDQLKMPGAVWFKMPVADLTDVDAMMGAGGLDSVDQSGIKMFAKGLKADGGLEQLGKIVAADMYNSNCDRFSPEGSTSGKQYGGRSISFKALVNVGNLFMIGKSSQQRMSVSGHDFLDPFGPNRDFNKGLNETWPGHALCDRTKRKQFAKKIVDDLEQILTPGKKSKAIFGKLGYNAAGRLEKGMKLGMAEIVQKLDKEYAGGGLQIGRHRPGGGPPSGVKERLDAYRKAV